MAIKEAQVSGSQSEHRWSRPVDPTASWPRLNGDLVDLLGICQGKKNHVSSGKGVNLEFRKGEAAYNNSLLPLYRALHFTNYIHYSIWFSLQKIL